MSLFRSSIGLMWSASPSRTLLTLGVQSVTSLSIFLQVLLIKQVFDAVLQIDRESAGIQQALLPVTALAVLTAATTIASTVANLQQRVLGELVAREVWRRVLTVSAAVDLSAFEDPGFYDQLQRVRSNAAVQVQIVVQALVVVLGGVLGVAAGTVAVLAIAPLLLPLLLLSGVPLFFVSRISGRLEFNFAVRQSTRLRERSYLQTVLTRREEAKEVRAFSLSSPMLARWERKYSIFLTDFQKHVKQRLRLAVLGNVLSAVCIAGTLALALHLIQRGSLSVTSAATALIAVRLLGGRVSSVVAGLSRVHESSLFLQDLQGFLGRDPTGAARVSGEAPPGFDRLSIVDVGFTYPQASGRALNGVSLDITRGEVVALVGENGSGKTTLAKLLANLYEPETGCVLWDGVDVRTMDTEGVRKQIAVMFQDFVKYQLSARDNIGIGLADEDAHEEQVLAAARHADAHGFLHTLTAGYETVLSKEYPGGTDLSLGQWQRVALARAFARQAPLVILDEPSSALDARAEHDLFARLRDLFVGRTVVIISHRFSTVRLADRIFVLDQGRVLEHGNHDSLMASGGRYAELFALQASGFLDDRRDE